ncbi:tetratricopeptide repeat protein [Commensalibacter communis]|uniref:tetratricopeptide repeat protein n=1 Tax=Commensalibacter communis TaxID=2972786 RepID=UPI00232EC0D1|nr:tetratricopeptide repeat protein [Commensalibacter communis]
MGYCIIMGNGVSKDKTKGKALIEKAANQNNVDAQTKMGDICKDEGILLMNSGRYKPADIANPQLRDKAMTELDEIESKIEPLRKKAKDWYEKAANQNGAEAQYKLAEFYHYGISVEKNKQLEEHWLQESAFHGYLEAEKEYASAVRDGDFGSKKAGVAIFFY